METVLVERDDGIVTVTMDRPAKRNAANDRMWRELQDTFDDIAGRDDDRVMILTGAGGAFCSGADLTDVDNRRHPLARMRQVGDVALALHRLPKPTIAKVGGVAAGAGCNMALACDLILASDEARFCEIFSRRGLSLDFGGSWLLPRLIGLHRAKELALFGGMLAAKEAADIGLVNRVVPAAELDALASDWARRLVAGPPLALSMTKTMLNRSFEVSFDQALEDEARAQVINFSSRDTAEGMMAFVERREPRFEGR
ncbi:MAG: enoyl-CoA hydratase [Actinomycetota bacterium]|nr:enoyl-CoA hydratase [Actinomycetota bacterium]